MSKISELSAKLQRNDKNLISQISGVPYPTVMAILNGHRSADTTQGRKVVRSAEIIIENREALIKNRKALMGQGDN